MCYSIIIAIHSKDYDNFKRSFTSHTYPVNPGFLSCYLPDEVITFSVTDGMCACDLYSEQRRRLTPEESGEKIEQLRKRLKRKKRNRGLTEEELTKQVERLMQEPPVSVAEGFSKGLAWTVLLNIKRLMQKTANCWLFIYWISKETVQDQTKMSISDFLTEDYFCQENVLYQIMAIRENSEVETG
jgi:hypothetical protein